MRSAFFTAVSILLIGWVMWVYTGGDPLRFCNMLNICVVSVSGFSAIRYTIMGRNQLLGGALGYWQSVIFSMRFYLYCGLVLTLGVFLFLYFHPDFLAAYFNAYEALLKDLKESGQDVSSISDLIEMSRDSLLAESPLNLAFDSAFSYCFFGTIASLFYSFFLTKEKKNGKA